MEPNNFDKMWDEIGHDLGWHDHNMQRDRPYNGQPHTDTGTRGRQEISGVTMRDIRDCFFRAYIKSHNYYVNGSIQPIQPNSTLIDEANKGVNGVISENDLYTLIGGFDPVAVSQNLTCEIEKIMGIYPNVPELTIKTED